MKHLWVLSENAAQCQFMHNLCCICYMCRWVSFNENSAALKDGCKISSYAFWKHMPCQISFIITSRQLVQISLKLRQMFQLMADSFFLISSVVWIWIWLLFLPFQIRGVVEGQCGLWVLWDELGRINASVGGCEYILISYPRPHGFKQQLCSWSHVCVYISI